MRKETRIRDFIRHANLRDLKKVKDYEKAMWGVDNLPYSVYIGLRKVIEKNKPLLVLQQLKFANEHGISLKDFAEPLREILPPVLEGDVGNKELYKELAKKLGFPLD